MHLTVISLLVSDFSRSRPTSWELLYYKSLKFRSKFPNVNCECPLMALHIALGLKCFLSHYVTSFPDARHTYCSCIIYSFCTLDLLLACSALRTAPWECLPINEVLSQHMSLWMILMPKRNRLLYELIQQISWFWWRMIQHFCTMQDQSEAVRDAGYTLGLEFKCIIAYCIVFPLSYIRFTWFELTLKSLLSHIWCDK